MTASLAAPRSAAAVTVIFNPSAYSPTTLCRDELGTTLIASAIPSGFEIRRMDVTGCDWAAQRRVTEARLTKSRPIGDDIISLCRFGVNQPPRAEIDHSDVVGNHSRRRYDR